MCEVRGAAHPCTAHSAPRTFPDPLAPNPRPENRWLIRPPVVSNLSARSQPGGNSV